MSSLITSVITVNDHLAICPDNQFVIVNSIKGPITVTLANSTSVAAGTLIFISDSNGNSAKNNIIINASGGCKINNNDVYTIDINYTCIALIKGNNNNYSILSGANISGEGAGSGDVSGPTEATLGDIAFYDDVTGQLIADSGISYTFVPTADEANALAGSYGYPSLTNPYVTSTDPRLSQTGGGNVTGPNSSVSGNLTIFNGVTGQLISDSGISMINVPTSNEAAALAGTNGTPSALNKYVTDSDPRLSGGGGGGYSYFPSGWS